MISTRWQKVIFEEVIQITKFMPPLTLRLAGEKAERPSSGSVSVRRLQQPLPKKAVRLMREAETLAAAGNRTAAMEKLRTALELCHGCVEARINLGAQLVRLGQMKEAQEQFQAAIDAGPPVSIAYSNLAYVLFLQHRWEESERAARQAVALDHHSAKAHYLLGNVLAVEGKSLPEALKELDAAAPEMPQGSAVGLRR